VNIQEILSIPRLPVRARVLVEGFLAGQHRSPYHGFSVEFSEHRPYTPGDDLRFLDWKVYARRERLYVKRFEEETNLRAYLLLDVSGSMAFGTKWEVARTLAAALAYLLHLQRDAVALWTFPDRGIYPPRTGRLHLQRIFGTLESLRPYGPPDLSAFREALPAMRSRSLVLWITDGLMPPEAFLEAVRLSRTARRDVLIFQILDEDEFRFPFRGSLRFVDLETGEAVEGVAEALKTAYASRLEAHLQHLRDALLSLGVEHTLLSTEGTFLPALLALLHHRKRWF